VDESVLVRVAEAEVVASLVVHDDPHDQLKRQKGREREADDSIWSLLQTTRCLEFVTGRFPRYKSR